MNSIEIGDQSKKPISPSEIIPRQLDEMTPVQQEFIQGVNADRAILERVESIFTVAIKIGLVKPNKTLSLSGLVDYAPEVIQPIIENSVNNPKNYLLSSEENRRVYTKLIFDKRFHGIDDCVGFTQSEVEVAVINGRLGLLQHDGSYLPIEKGQLKQTICEAIKNPITTERY